MRIISIFLYWIATRFWTLTSWFDTHEFPSWSVGYFFSKLGKRIYPDGYCRGCGIWVDPRIKDFYYNMGWVFNSGTDPEFKRPFCSSCNKSPTEKQLEIYQKWREKHPIKIRS